MKASYRWLQDYVSISMGPDDLANEFERIGIETEEIEHIGEGLESVVVGKVLSHEPHPRADKLRVAQVAVGADILDIVCGAPNLRARSNVAVALPGTILPDGTKIIASEIRGIPSHGSLLSEKELGVSDDHSGIIILPSSLKSGAAVAPYYELDDHIFELEITPNRPDLLCMVGIAREICAATGRKLRFPRTQVAESSERVEESASLDVKDPRGCPRYMARIVKGVKIGQSPRWLALRLKRCGLNEINNVVDATNYALLELGHPLHPFDLDCVDGGEIVVRRAENGEKMVTLDGDEKTLRNDVLLIADRNKPLAIAGIVGGVDSGVTLSTTDVLLESAFFDPPSIRRASRNLGLETEASIRFEKKADISIIPDAANRACLFISEIAGGRISRGSLDFYPEPETRAPISLNRERVNRLLGLELTKREIYSSLRRLHIETDKELTSNIPSFRRDLKEDVDLIEEVARIYGYERIPSTNRWKGGFVGTRNARSVLINQLRQRLIGLGFTEVYALSFVDLELTKSEGFAEGVELIRINNPLSERWNGLRNTLLSSLVTLAEGNLKRGKESMKMFEVGKAFRDSSGTYTEDEHLALLSTGGRTFWNGDEERVDFYSLKGDVESFLDSLDIGEVNFTATTCPFFHPGRASQISLQGENLGIIGECIPTQKTPARIYAAELNLEVLLPRMTVEKLYQPISRFPVVERDLALVAGDELPEQEVLRVIRREGGIYLESVHLFDLYVGNGIPEGTKSLTYRMRFRAKDRTLRDEDVDEVMDGILASLREELSVTLRGGSIGAA